MPLTTKNLEKAVRAENFYKTDKRGIAQIHIKNVASITSEPMPPLNSWRFPEDTERYLDALAKRDISYIQRRGELDDDFISALQPWYGIAEHSAFLGGAVDFSETTSYQHEICDTIEKCAELTLDENNMWLKMVCGGIKYLKDKYGDIVPARMRGCHGISDLANSVRGAGLCYDIYDSPDELCALLDFCVKAIDFTFDRQRAAATRINDGIVNGFGVWMPGNSIGHISEDFSCMISNDSYEEFFLPRLRALTEGHEMTMLHVHSLGKRLIPMFASLKKLKIMEISSDPGNPRAVDVYREYKRILNDAGMCVVVAPTRDELFGMEDLLSDGKTIIWYYAKDENDARDAMKFVEKYRI